MKPASPSVFPAGRLALRISLHVASLLAVALFAGCASTTVVKVDSLAKADVPVEAGLSYEIHSSNPLVPEDSLRYKEAAEYVKTALSGKGMYEAPANTTPDVIVDFDYGIGPPQSRMETRREPVYRDEPGRIRRVSVVVGTDAVGRPITDTIFVTDPPTRVIDHYLEYEVPITVYEKYIRLTARSTEPVPEGRPQPELWTVDITAEGESRDLRKNLPVLVAASINQIGKDSRGEKVVKIKDEGEDVAFIKKGL